jgi:hypothetical protein
MEAFLHFDVRASLLAIAVYQSARLPSSKYASLAH